MPPRVRQTGRKKPLDHVADALLHLEAAELAVARIDMDRVPAAARRRIEALRKAVSSGKTACASSIEALLDAPAPVVRKAAPSSREAAS